MSLVMDRNLARLTQTGSSIPPELQRDDTGPAPDPAARGWERVRQMRGAQRTGAPSSAPPDPAQTGLQPGNPPANRALRQFLATGASAPPSARAQGRTAEVQQDGGPQPQGDYGPWARRGSTGPATHPAGYETVMGHDV